ncbi:MAG: hypothetical protein A2V90_00430 [Gammaproteobacteria bacterium RBG_16_57_12]|nr:MAG: hypothetical protein A2V90_00430 [Gammaproteobacteria bacterium RBG_16_57_12]
MAKYLLAGLISVIAPHVLAAGAGVAGSTEMNIKKTVVLGEYADKANAIVHINKLKREGRNGAIKTVRLPVYVKRLEVGYYATQQQAQAIVTVLHGKGMTTASVVEGARGFAVAVGVFLEPKNLLKQQHRLKNLGFGNTHVVAGEMMREMFQVVEAAPPASDAPARGAAPGTLPLAAGDAAARQIIPYLFLTLEEAEGKVAQLAREGATANMETIQYKALQLRYYKHQSDAEMVVSVLEQYGIRARYIKSDSGRGYVVMVMDTIYDQDELERRLRQLRYIGFDNARIDEAPAYLVNHTIAINQPGQGAGDVLTFSPGQEGAGISDVLVFGGNTELFSSVGQVKDGKSRSYKISLADARMEGGMLTDSKQGVDSSNYFHAELVGIWNPSRSWEVQLAGRVDAYQQTGVPEYNDADADYADSYIRYRGDNYRLTAGAQTVIWGRVDEVPPIDRLSVQDLSRHMLDDLPNRRRAVPAIRLERFFGANKLDVLWVPVFRPAELPDPQSIWSPVDKINGRIIGTPSSTLLGQLIKAGSFAEDDDGQGGGGIRYSRTGKGLDYAFTVQRARHSQPYYELNPVVAGVLLTSLDAALALSSSNEPTFLARHPMTWIAGADFGIEAGDATWRFEMAYLSDMPVTTTTLAMATTAAIDWVGGVEFYPGEAGTRINAQITGHHLLDNQNIVDRDAIYTFNGAIETLFAHDRWRFHLRFLAGLDEHDVYLNPELSYLGWEPSEIYIGGHYFAGDDGTLGGFHQDHSLATLGWRVKY